jgi:hypothetical protein
LPASAPTPAPAGAGIWAYPHIIQKPRQPFGEGRHHGRSAFQAQSGAPADLVLARHQPCHTLGRWLARTSRRKSAPDPGRLATLRAGPPQRALPCLLPLPLCFSSQEPPAPTLLFLPRTTRSHSAFPPKNHPLPLCFSSPNPPASMHFPPRPKMLLQPTCFSLHLLPFRLA